MDLSSLDSTLPPALADAERDMGDKFRASALNITNMYKSSLGYMKQGYGVGYAACLADVLSTVQSSMSAGQDPTLTLSRLMDWAEARETAMTALANDDDDAAHTPYMSKSRPSRTNLARQAMAAHQTPAMEKEKEDGEYRGRPRQNVPGPLSTPVSTESSTHADGGPVTPMTSSPAVAASSSSHIRPHIKSRASASRSPSNSTATSSRVPQSADFTPALPVNTAHLSSNLSTSSLPTGSKRPLLDIDMADGNNSLPSSPITPNRGPRANKRRSMGLGLGHKEDEDRGDRDRKRGGRRGHGHGHGHGPGHGSSGQAT